MPLLLYYNYHRRCAMRIVFPHELQFAVLVLLMLLVVLFIVSALS